MKTLIFSAFALSSLLGFGSLQARAFEGPELLEEKACIPMPPKSIKGPKDFAPGAHHPLADKPLPPPAPAGEISSDSLPVIPDLPVFPGWDSVSQSFRAEDPGSVLELWFRKEGVSEKDIKVLSQLPSDQKTLIRKIVQSYQIDMQRTILELRPSYQKIRDDMDMLKLELSRMLLAASDGVRSDEASKVLTDIAAKEEELKNLQKIQDKIVGVFRSEMKDQITDVVNSWISAQASKDKESLTDLFSDAEAAYGLNWD